jgi:hypothetical protein
MNYRDKYYIELAEATHQAVLNWDPVGLILGGAPDDEYDAIEKRFLSGVINSDSDESVIEKVKENLEYFGLNFKEMDYMKKKNLNSEILMILNELRSIPLN